MLCYAFAFNKDCSIIAAGYNNQIIIYEFKKEILQQIQILNQHLGNVLALNFMKKSNMLISGSGPGDNSILIWQSNKNNQWICSQKVHEQKDLIQCLIVNNNEDLIISGSDDKAIKFWVKQNEWICSQTITDHKSYIHQLSLNDQQNQVISCGYDNLILIIEYSEQNGNWSVIQKINVDCYGYRFCFINDYLFTFKQRQDNLSKQFNKKKDIIVNQGDGCNILFPYLNLGFKSQRKFLFDLIIFESNFNQYQKSIKILQFTNVALKKDDEILQFLVNFKGIKGFRLSYPINLSSCCK